MIVDQSLYSNKEYLNHDKSPRLNQPTVIYVTNAIDLFHCRYYIIVTLFQVASKLYLPASLRRASVCLCKAETSSSFLDKASSLTCWAVKLSSRICLGIQRRSLPECIHFTASGVTFTLMTFPFTTFSALSARYWGSFRATGKQNTRYSVSGIQDGDQNGPW